MRPTGPRGPQKLRTNDVALLLPGRITEDARLLKEDAPEASTDSSKRGLERAAPDKGKKGSGREDANWGFLCCDEEVLVPADKDLDASGEGGCQDSLVIWIS